MACKDLGPPLYLNDFSAPQGNTYEITIGEHDSIVVIVDYGTRGKTRTLISPSGARIFKESTGAKIEQDFSLTPESTV